MDTKLKEITWHAPEFKYRYKDISWYWLSFAVAGVLILLSLWQKNLLFIIFIIIAESMIIIWANRFPKELRFKLDKKGVYIDKINFYPYEELDGFHILENEDEDSDLILKTDSKIHPYIKIMISSEDIEEIKSFLQNYLEEVEYEESFVDRVENLLGF